MINIKELELLYFQNSKDVPYKLKKGGILYIKPILVEDYSEYEYSKEILEINKNEFNDIRIIQMSYLQFLSNLVFQDTEQIIASQLVNICRLCFGNENVTFSLDKGKTVLVLKNSLNEIQHIISSKEFDEIIKIILNQNNPSYDNRYITPEVKELLYEYNKIKYKDVRCPTLEERKAFVCSKIGKTFKEINAMTYREFDLIYEASVNSEIYIGQKIIQGSYKYQVNEDIMHPLYQKKTDPYESIFEDTSKLSGKGISGAEGLNSLNMKGED